MSAGSPETHEITRLLVAMRNGDASALSALVPLVYDELRGIAANLMRQERPDHTLEPTALVHEAFIQLVESGKRNYENRIYFFGVAARLMRWILLDHARKHASQKRGGAVLRIPLDAAEKYYSDHAEDLLALDEALGRLEKEDERAARIVELRYFAGLNAAEIARVLDISEATVQRDWVFAKAWLTHELRGERP